MELPTPPLLSMGAAAVGVGVIGAVADVAPLGIAAGALGLVGIVLSARTPRPRADTPITSASSPESESDTTTDASIDPTLIDSETGLYTEAFFRTVIEARVSAARRHLRPVAVVLFDAVDANGQRVEAIAVADAIKATLREADTACRFKDGRFAFVLEDTPEDGAIWTVERLRRKLASTGGDLVRRSGIACYPAHAFNAVEVVAKAEQAFAAATEWSQDRIEVARPD
jgi:diguanylate cyclase (GGDEF)-like protein